MIPMMLLEAVILALVLLDLVLLRTGILAGIGLLAFLGAYLLYRREARLNTLASSHIREAMTVEEIKELENRYSSMEGFRTPEARALSRPPLERYFYRLRYERVRRLLDLHAQDARKALDMGCGFGVHTGYLQRE
ncbi:MAG: hypothetical protein K9M82_06155, partial [Deltaproteobacteria bacterium]|nr:hypothetical protein [Deltaproteobacteria bacterium]